MRRLILAVLIISAVLLVACVEPAPAPPTPSPTPTPETTPEPMPTPAPEPEPEPEESPVSMPFVASELRNLNTAMVNITSGYTTSGYITSGTLLLPCDDSWVHEFCVEGDGGWWHSWTMPASDIFEARTHIGNAYWLTNKSRLLGEISKRDVYTDEIFQEVNEAKTLLEQQVSYSYSHQEGEIKWIIESKIPHPRSGFVPQASKEVAVENLNDVYIEYREEFSRVITRLELVLSKLPKDNVIFSLQ